MVEFLHFREGAGVAFGTLTELDLFLLLKLPKEAPMPTNPNKSRSLVDIVNELDTAAQRTADALELIPGNLEPGSPINLLLGIEEMALAKVFDLIDELTEHAEQLSFGKDILDQANLN